MNSGLLLPFRENSLQKLQITFRPSKTSQLFRRKKPWSGKSVTKPPLLYWVVDTRHHASSVWLSCDHY